MRLLPVTDKNYSPLYFLNALGAGGLAVSFFMYLMWMTPHEGLPIATYASLIAAFSENGIVLRALIILAVSGVAYFSVSHIRLLIWNALAYSNWRKSEAYHALRRNNGETQLMAAPLAFAMTGNVLFIVGAVFVPRLWDVREFLFPLALAAFAATGFTALRFYLAFISRVLAEGGYDCAKANNFSQMIAVFAFSMTAVGFSASAAMSHDPSVIALAFAGAVFFIAAAFVVGAINLVLGFRAMMEHRADAETTPTLWIVIPILTVLGIALYRLKMSLVHHFGAIPNAGEMFAFLIAIMAVQLFFGLIGLAVMRKVGYFKKWVKGPDLSPGSYALICPGVALFVFGNFVMHAGLVKIGVLDTFSAAYWILYLPLVYVQFLTIKIFARLNKKLFGKGA